MPERRYVSPDDERLVDVRRRAREIVRQSAAIFFDNAVDEGLPDVESPIEEMFLYALIGEIHSRWAGIRFAAARDPLSSKKVPKSTIDILPLVNWDLLGKYRGDIVLQRLAPWKDKMRKVLAQLVVELDGHEFHERTKEQAEKDKRRDRELVAEGYQVIRFTGSEVWRDPFKCAEEAVDMIMQMPDREWSKDGPS